MKDTIEVLSAPSGRKEHTLKVRKSIPLYGGGGEKKVIVYAFFAQGEESKSVSLIERGFSGDAKVYIKNWIAFKKAGLPVVSTCRETSKGTVVVTNVKADGSEIYGKGLWLALYSEKHSIVNQGTQPRMPHPLDQTFLELTEDKRIEEIRKRVNEMVERANNNHIALNFDDACELHIHPDKSWELIILDLTMGGKVTNAEFGRSLRRMLDGNRRAADRFIDDLRNLRRLLEESQRK